MRIAQVAPLIERVPPVKYGGTELVISLLTEELVKRGHKVTLFASGDSITRARLVGVVDKHIGRLKGTRARQVHQSEKSLSVYTALLLGRVFEHAKEFDVIHCHLGPTVFPFTRLVKTPAVFTLHGRLDIPDLKVIHTAYKEVPLISISNNQRKPIPNLNYVATIYHGLPLEQFPFSSKHEDYLFFLGRISPEKGPVEAIKLAKKTNHKLIMVAKVDPVDKDFYEREVKHLIDGKQIVYVGEVTQEKKLQFLKSAKALLATIQWEEPFGLFMIEALACGTPVIATKMGSAPEIIKDGVNGFLIKDIKEGVEAIKKIDTISRARCREVAENRFSLERMVDEYEKVYERLARI